VTNKEYEVRKKKIEQRNQNIKKEQQLKKLRDKYKKKRNKLSMSKTILLLISLFCIQIAIFAEVFMWHYGDSNALYALIGIPVALMPTIIAYFNKSAKENCKDGITYDMAMLEANNAITESSVGDSDDGSVG